MSTNKGFYSYCSLLPPPLSHAESGITWRTRIIVDNEFGRHREETNLWPVSICQPNLPDCRIITFPKELIHYW